MTADTLGSLLVACGAGFLAGCSVAFLVHADGVRVVGAALMFAASFGALRASFF